MREGGLVGERGSDDACGKKGWKVRQREIWEVLRKVRR